MDKYIDSEYLKRILQRVVEHLKEKGADKEVRVIESVIKFLKVMERFHSVEVVRRKDCKRWGAYPDGEYGMCHCLCRCTGKNDFCSYGKRRTEDVADK